MKRSFATLAVFMALGLTTALPFAAAASLPTSYGSVVRDVGNPAKDYSRSAPIEIAVGSTGGAIKTVVLRWYARPQGPTSITVSAFEAFLDGASARAEVLGVSGPVTLRSAGRVLVRITVSDVSSKQTLSGALVASVNGKQRILAALTAGPASNLSNLTVVNAGTDGLKFEVDERSPVLPVQVRNDGSSPLPGVVASGTLVAPDGTLIDLKSGAQPIPGGRTVVFRLTATHPLADVGPYVGSIDLSSSSDTSQPPVSTAVSLVRKVQALEVTPTVVSPGMATIKSGDADVDLDVTLVETGGRDHEVSLDATQVTVFRSDDAGTATERVDGVTADQSTIHVAANQPTAKLPVHLSGLPGPGRYVVRMLLKDEREHQITVEGKANVRRTWWVAGSLIAIGVALNLIFLLAAPKLLKRARNRTTWATGVRRLRLAPAARHPATVAVLAAVLAEARQVDRSSDAVNSFERKTRVVVQWIPLNDRARHLDAVIPELKGIADCLLHPTFSDGDLTSSETALDDARKKLVVEDAKVAARTLRAEVIRTEGWQPTPGSFQGIRSTLDTAAAADGANDVDRNRHEALRAWTTQLADDLDGLMSGSLGGRALAQRLADAHAAAQEFRTAPPSVDPSSITRTYKRCIGLRS